MNEQIKELMIQAGFDPASIERMGVMPNAEKFAELIVKECCKVSDEVEHSDFKASKFIKLHFGVK